MSYYAPVFKPPAPDPTAVPDPKYLISREGDKLVANRYGHIYTFFPSRTPNCSPLPTHTYETIQLPGGYDYHRLSPFFDAWHKCYNNTVAQIAAVASLGGTLVTVDGIVLVAPPTPPVVVVSPPAPPSPQIPPSSPVPLPPVLPPLPDEQAPAPSQNRAVGAVLVAAGVAAAIGALFFGGRS